jgi:hypothetical protein
VPPREEESSASAAAVLLVVCRDAMSAQEQSQVRAQMLPARRREGLCEAQQGSHRWAPQKVPRASQNHRCPPQVVQVPVKLEQKAILRRKKFTFCAENLFRVDMTGPPENSDV